MARLEAVSHPKRAALLMQALKQSKENLTASKLNAIIKLLSQEQLKRAVENQQDVRKDLQALLELLMSENRSDRLKTDQERIREYLGLHPDVWVVGLCEGTMLRVEDDSIRPLGDQPCRVFRRGQKVREVAPDASFEFLLR